jgi:mono/diheme cytochrome c family protein
VPNLTGEHARKSTDERIAAKISEGDHEMPAFKDKLTAPQIQDLVRFIRKEFQGR